MARNNPPGARREVPRSRGALSGIALIVLGVWGALIPFVGPYFDFSFTPDKAWHWTAARGWLEVLPGVVAFVAGVLLLVSKSRVLTLVAAWLGIAAGAWFAVGPQLQSVWHIGSPGRPAGSSAGLHALETLALFTLLGVVIVYFAATAFGRLSVVSLRDARAAERREAEAAAAAERERQIAAARDRDAAAAREREAAQAAAAHERHAAGDDAGDADDDRPVTDTASAEGPHDRAEAAPVSTGSSAPVDDDEHDVRGAHPATPQPDAQEPATQPGHVRAGTAEQGYAQPQRYDPQHGYAQQAASAQPADTQADTRADAPADTQADGLGRRLFRRR